MKLNLSKPLAFFDLETTGVDVSKDKIVEISILKVNKDGSKESLTKKINPGIPIPLATSEVHGIYDIDVINEPNFKEASNEIADFIGDADLAGFNSNKFDIPLLMEEFARVNHPFSMNNRKQVDVQNIFHKMEQRTLVAAYKFYCDKDLTNAHSAEADTTATYEVLMGQLEKYEELEGNTDFLHDFSKRGNFLDFAGRIAEDENKTPVFNFGKYKGRSVKEVLQENPGYYGWMMNGDFPAYTKKVLKEIKES